jgi:hypothetical protein
MLYLQPVTKRPVPRTVIHDGEGWYIKPLFLQFIAHHFHDWTTYRGPPSVAIREIASHYRKWVHQLEGDDDVRSQRLVCRGVG